MTDHDPHDEPQGFGFAVPVPGGLLDGLRHHHDMQTIERATRASRIDRFMDGLDVDGLLALRDILNQDSASAMNNFFDGQCVTLLRRIHHVDPQTGDPEIPAAPAADGGDR